MPGKTKIAKKSIVSGQVYSRRQFLAASSLLPYALLSLGSIRGRDALAQTVSYDFYISPTGSDHNPGTLAQPWAITAINTKRSSYAGKRVGLLDGTYYVAALAAGFQDSDQIVLDVASGIPSSPTIIQAVNPLKAIIDGTDGNGNRVNHYYASGCGIIGQTYLTGGDTGYVTLQNLVIRNGYRYLVHFRYSGGLQDGPRFSGVTIDSCDISDINFTGGAAGNNQALVEVYNTDGLIVRNCKLYTARGNSPSDANGYGIQTWCCNNSLFEYNSITDCKDGIYVKHVYQTGVIVRYNFIDLTAYTGGGDTAAMLGFEFSTPGVQHANIHHNVFKADDGWRVHETGTILQGPCQYWNNVVVPRTASFTLQGIQAFGGTQPIDVYNNIVARSGAAADQGDLAVSVGDTGHVDYNHYPSTPKLCSANGTDSYPDNTYTSIAAFNAATRFDAHSTAGSPGFVGSGTDALYYQLASGSVCINAGKSNGTTSGTTCDIGAWGNNAPSRIGCDFTQLVPDAPQIHVS